MKNTAEAALSQWFEQLWNQKDASAIGRMLHEGWNCFDFLSMYRQVDVPLDLPAPQP